MTVDASLLYSDVLVCKRKFADPRWGGCLHDSASVCPDAQAKKRQLASGIENWLRSHFSCFVLYSTYIINYILYCRLYIGKDGFFALYEFRSLTSAKLSSAAFYFLILFFLFTGIYYYRKFYFFSIGRQSTRWRKQNGHVITRDCPVRKSEMGSARTTWRGTAKKNNTPRQSDSTVQVLYPYRQCLKVFCRASRFQHDGAHRTWVHVRASQPPIWPSMEELRCLS